MYLVFHRLWIRFIFKYGSWFFVNLLLEPVLWLHTMFGDSDTSSKGVSCRAFLRDAECSQLWFVNTLGLILFCFKTKEKKAWGELSFSVNDKPIFHPPPAAAASGVHLVLSRQGHNNFARRITLLGENWSPGLDRKKHALLWLWMERWLLTAGQIFVIFLWPLRSLRWHIRSAHKLRALFLTSLSEWRITSLYVS